jgi:hypothetical protein
MPLTAIVFIAGLVVSVLVATSVVFTIYEIRRTNPNSFGPKPQVQPPSDP